uniref:DDE_Tnp_1_7 domain-containing protein n=1 Tax=Bursaphelenchus xylophilus TaxID=6326 RepID=A0A1I7RT74_BURXY
MWAERARRKEKTPEKKSRKRGKLIKKDETGSGEEDYERIMDMVVRNDKNMTLYYSGHQNKITDANDHNEIRFSSGYLSTNMFNSYVRKHLMSFAHPETVGITTNNRKRKAGVERREG